LKEVNPIALRLDRYCSDINFMSSTSLLFHNSIYLNHVIINLMYDLLGTRFKLALLFIRIYTNTLYAIKNIILIFYKKYLCYKKFKKKKKY